MSTTFLIYLTYLSLIVILIFLYFINKKINDYKIIFSEKLLEINLTNEKKFNLLYNKLKNDNEVNYNNLLQNTDHIYKELFINHLEKVNKTSEDFILLVTYYKNENEKLIKMNGQLKQELKRKNKKILKGYIDNDKN